MSHVVNDNIDTYQRLINAFSMLPATKTSRTFMDVSGYPHYENVCSNILGFYFDPTAEHGLKNMLLAAFMRMAGGKEVTLSGKVSVQREYSTQKGNRIDLVIEGEDFVLCIENKIYHWIANDLTDYARDIDKLGSDKVNGGKKVCVIKSVLGLKPILEPLKGEFVSYTYGQLWQSVREMIGHYIAQADTKWVTYLIDFMETTTNLAGENMELKQVDQFLIEHDETIEKLLRERDSFKGRLKQRIAELSRRMEDATEINLLKEKPYPYSSDRLVLDFNKLAGQYVISFDLYLTPAGWDLQLFGRDLPSGVYLRNPIKPALKELMLNATEIGDRSQVRFSVQKWPVTTDLDEIRDVLRSWIVAIDKASKEMS